ncbi:MAG: hypothetical protein JNM31_06955 [Flavobacteriales bacterium]|nr:hypothetical protein [Flavobacteriales bacterium]
MRTTELTFIAAVTLSCVFKIMHWPGAAFLIVIGGGSLALFYFPLGFRTLPAPKPTDQILWLTIPAGAALCVASCGIVAFLQRWPHSATMLVTGSIACALSAVVALWLRYKHPRQDIYLDGILVRCLVVGMIAITLWKLYSGKPR